MVGADGGASDGAPEGSAAVVGPAGADGAGGWLLHPASTAAATTATRTWGLHEDRHGRGVLATARLGVVVADGRAPGVCIRASISDGTPRRPRTVRSCRRELPSAEPSSSEEPIMTVTTLSVPEIHCEHCRAAIEGAVGPIDGVEGVEVDIPAALVRVTHDPDLTLRSVVDAIEDQGYDVPEQDALADG